MVPTGLDDRGRPTAVAFWGRGVPVERLFDDRYAVTHDIAFLHTAGRLVAQLQREPDLRRKDAPAVESALHIGGDNSGGNDQRTENSGSKDEL